MTSTGNGSNSLNKTSSVSSGGIEEIIESASIFYEKKQYEKAINEYLNALKLDPKSITCLICLGNAFSMLQQNDKAILCYEDVIKINNKIPEAYYNKSIIFYDLKKYTQSKEALMHAISLDSNYVEAWISLGHVSLKLNESNEAIRAYQRALDICPNHIAAYSLAGCVKNKNRAEELYLLSIKLNSNFALAYFDLGCLYTSHKEWGRAKEQFKKAINVDCNFYKAYNNLGVVNIELGNNKKAVTAFEKAIDIKPGFQDPYLHLGRLWLNTDYTKSIKYYKHALLINSCKDDDCFCYGYALEAVNDTKSARNQFSAAYELNNSNLRALWSKNLCLPIIYDNDDEIIYWRSVWSKGIKRLRAEIEEIKWESAEHALQFISYTTNFHLHYQGYNDRKLQSAYGEMLNYIGAMACPENRKLAEDKITTLSKIKVAFVIPHSSTRHTIYKLFKGWVEKINRKLFEVHGIIPVDCNTAEKESIEMIFDQSHFIGNEKIVNQINKIKSFTFDVIIYTDIGMIYAVQPLASLRLAPVQCATWGHPVTSGLETIDYFISSKLMEPQNAEEHYTEKLIELSNLSINYNCEVNIEPSKITENIFFCSQSIYKILPEFDCIIAQIAIQLRDAKFLFLNHPAKEITNKFKSRIRNNFKKFGLNSEEFCVFLPRCEEKEFLNIINNTKIIIDTIHWSGGNTSLEAISCGKPVITLPGDMMRSRHTFAMLKLLSLEELIAKDQRQLIKIAIRLATDDSKYDQIVCKLNKNKKLLFNDMTPVLELEKFMENAVKLAVK